MLTRTPADAEAVRRGHRRTSTVRLRRPDGYDEVVPVHRGEIRYNMSSDQGVRSGTLIVPGYQWWHEFTTGPYCWVEVDLGIEQSSWSHGEFPVTRISETRPGGEIRVELGDWAFRRYRSVSINPDSHLYEGVTVAQMAALHMTDVMPNTVTVTLDETGGAMVPSDVRVPAGQNFWTAMTRVANNVGATIVMKSQTELELRVYDPDKAVDEDITGTVALSETEIDHTRAVNGVFSFVDSESYDGPSHRAQVLLWTGDRHFSRTYGHAPVVEQLRVPTSTQAIADAEAQRIYDRRVGVLRSVYLEVIEQPWLVAGDVITWTTEDGQRQEVALIDSISHPIEAQAICRITTRDRGVI
jgi:hypothetical protein